MVLAIQYVFDTDTLLYSVYQTMFTFPLHDYENVTNEENQFDGASWKLGPAAVITLFDTPLFVAETEDADLKNDVNSMKEKEQPDNGETDKANRQETDVQGDVDVNVQGATWTLGGSEKSVDMDSQKTSLQTGRVHEGGEVQVNNNIKHNLTQPDSHGTGNDKLDLRAPNWSLGVSQHVISQQVVDAEMKLDQNTIDYCLEQLNEPSPENVEQLPVTDVTNPENPKSTVEGKWHEVVTKFEANRKKPVRDKGIAEVNKSPYVIRGVDLNKDLTKDGWVERWIVWRCPEK
ncbi:hypothetical protein E3N88_20868 [Mikania micrantha]|uniref:Uncharacterized protein n=1 Tax=Mikania micrantha TaxID=192012 RepID=A0A5N6NKU2_9ASTR|nr:hypothetical protein E3N88_20868 [Mikania micrantha]